LVYLFPPSPLVLRGLLEGSFSPTVRLWHVPWIEFVVFRCSPALFIPISFSLRVLELLFSLSWDSFFVHVFAYSFSSHCFYSALARFSSRRSVFPGSCPFFVSVCSCFSLWPCSCPVFCRGVPFRGSGVRHAPPPFFPRPARGSRDVCCDGESPVSI